MTRRSVAGILFAFVAIAAPRAASAQDVTGLSPGAGSPPPTGRVDIGAGRPYWGAGPARPFAAVTFESAGIAARTVLDLGYGKPHHLWAGLQIYSNLSLRGLGMYAGVAAVAPWGTVRFGPRFWTALGQKLITPVDVVTPPLLDVSEAPRSTYLSLDAEAAFQIPLPVGAIGILVTGQAITSVVEDYFVFEEALRVVMEPPFVGRARVSYLAGIGDPATLRVGGLAEVIYNPGRNYVNVRIGPAVAVSLTHHLEAVASVALSVYNPDEIGVAGADLGQIGLRYRWATGDLWPEFP